MWFDTHAHLPMLEHDPIPTILERAHAANVTRMVTVATEPKNWRPGVDAAAAHEGVYYSLGLHPHESADWEGCKTEMESMLNVRDPKCVAIGEIGLDYYYEHSKPEEQQRALREQLELAVRFRLPVIFHCREAFADLFRIVDEVGLKDGAVLHCFTGGKPDALQAVDRGFHISFSGILTFKNADGLRETAKALPAESLLVETDCPFLAPVPMRGKPNEPSFLPHTGQCLAALRAVRPEAIAEQTTKNAERFFRL